MVAPGWMSTPEREWASSAIRRGTMGTPSPVHRVRQAMRGDGQEARVGGDDLVERFGRRVAREDGLGVLEAAIVDPGNVSRSRRARLCRPAARSSGAATAPNCSQAASIRRVRSSASRAGCVANCGKRPPMSASKMPATSRLSGNGCPRSSTRGQRRLRLPRRVGRSGHGSPLGRGSGATPYTSRVGTSNRLVARCVIDRSFTVGAVQASSAAANGPDGLPWTTRGRTNRR